MIKILLHGACGRMGRVIAELAAADPDTEIAAGVDAFGDAYGGFPLYRELAEVNEPADVVIDFSSAAAVPGLLAYCAERKLPVVLCTTGLSGEGLAKLSEATERTAVLRSANMSLGINMLFRLLREAAPALAAEGFDIEIVEKHHSQKLDAPSGTAVSLAELCNEAVGGDYEIVTDRTSRREKRPKKEIGVSAVRGGTIVGDHDVIFAGTDETITFSHRAYSRAIFGKGAVAAAKFLAGKPAGQYDMQDVIG
ncbi:4-hydroxy-tetrahydrodipicolinate reductase [Lachnoclostridium sp. Marseille-P6806]|uniref:4-hydroxy-tetrahydrodipicolinate reductase n=1 Tax=Lachnoclostridium sp. Marseille-P6806 TaxID=2364793 RepID=UPI00102FC646|nr:4-hydroxy-tetrahydrodipicolinate reductase [Lachnoclostridium sp. Marseille-P6806]